MLLIYKVIEALPPWKLNSKNCLGTSLVLLLVFYLMEHGHDEYWMYHVGRVEVTSRQYCPDGSNMPLKTGYVYHK